MHISTLTWGITIALLALVLLLDIVVIGRRPHEPSLKECALFVAIYAAAAVGFGLGVGYVHGWRYGQEFFSGWMLEYSLSIDNLFMFIVILARMAVPREMQQYVLMVGIVLALVFRGAFIAIGAAMITAWAWVFFIFGAFLIWTAVSLVRDYRQKDRDEEATDNWFIRQVARLIPQSDTYEGKRWFTRKNGRRAMTPLFFVILMLGSTDVMFALDSIPAIYGVTEEPYLVLAANVFALMGLRQLYFLLGGLLTRLKYLPLGLSFILAFIGGKLLLHAIHATHLDARLGFSAWEVPNWLSLAVIVVTIAVTTVASIFFGPRENPDLGVDDADDEPIVVQAHERLIEARHLPS